MKSRQPLADEFDIHSYENFLAEHDPQTRDKRGVYYTPQPIVGYMVRCVEMILERDFAMALGLADERASILDPAVGTGAFTQGIVEHLWQSHYSASPESWPNFVRENLLPRFFGFELLKTPCAIARRNLALLLAKTGCGSQLKKAIKIQTANSLEAQFDAPIMVVIGNPPYEESSVNKGEWITDLLHGKDQSNGAKTADYYSVDGQPLGERNAKALLNDYVKFIRFAQRRIEQIGHGVVAFITDHNYLTAPVLRGMRHALLSFFDDIYILDLHGNKRSREQAPDGSPDANVFDIMQGVAITFFIKRQGERAAPLAKLHHAELWGGRGDKYDWLDGHDFASTAWETISPAGPGWLFTPVDATNRAEYLAAPSVTELFGLSVNGFKTHRDHFAIAFDKETLANRVRDLCATTYSDEELRQKYDLEDNRDWSLAAARKKLRALPNAPDYPTPALYRPFDDRFCFYGDSLMDFPRREFTNHVFGEILMTRPRPEFAQHVFGRENIGLIVGRQGQAVGDEEWNLVSLSDKVTDTNLFRRGGIQFFPLYLYPTGLEGGERRNNLNPALMREWSARAGLEIGPEDALAYAYALLHSPAYRQRYAEFLKTDYPRLPLSSNPELCIRLYALGRELIDLHLLRALPSALPNYPEAGEDIVEKPRYDGENQRLFINARQYLHPIAQEVWEFRIGGYEVLEKWLKERRGRKLSYAELEYLRRTISALDRTLDLMKKIDAAIDQEGGWPLG
jgi:predicted helicase